MLNRLNQRVLGLLFRSEIESGDRVEEARVSKRKEEPKMKTSREEIGGSSMQQDPSMPPQAPEYQSIPQSPIRNELKVGRNDPCPCGSGKKFKNCHGNG